LIRRVAAVAFACLLALAPVAGQARDKHVLWAVKGAHNTVYLLGSVHVLRPEDARLPDVVEHAYADAEKLVMEIDLDDPEESDPQAVLEQMQRLALLPDGQTLHSVLGSEYASINAQSQKYGLDLAVVDRFAPWFVAMTVLELELAKRGFSSEYGIEQTLATRATRDHKPIQGLETTAQQFGLLAGMPMPMQKRFLVMMLDESKQLDEELGELLRAWKAGDTATLARLLSEEFDEFPDLYRTLTVDRNRAWVDKLSRLLGERDDYLVVVGALHLVGRDSVVELLEKKGYRVEQE
jgi:hypothetical protein